MSYYTYRDAIDDLTEFVGGNSTYSGQQAIRRAIQDGYRDFANARDWLYLHKPYRILTNRPYSTGSIFYDHAGHGSGSRIVSLAGGGTWPTWAADGTLRVDTGEYQSVRRLSDVRLQLDENYNPGSDLATGSEFTIFQSRYALPETFVRMDRPQSENLWNGAEYVDPAEFLELEKRGESVGVPRVYSILQHPRLPQRYALCFYPAPDSALQMDMIMQVKPRPLVYTGANAAEITGTLTVASGSTTVTGTNTAWVTAMAGSILRISSNARVPTSLEGDNPFAVEKIIRSVESATSLTLTESVDTTYTGKGYSIADYVDCDPGTLNFAKRCFERQLAIRLAMERLPEVEASYQRAFAEACVADNVRRHPRQIGDNWRVGMYTWPSQRIAGES